MKTKAMNGNEHRAKNWVCETEVTACYAISSRLQCLQAVVAEATIDCRSNFGLNVKVKLWKCVGDSKNGAVQGGKRGRAGNSKAWKRAHFVCWTHANGGIAWVFGFCDESILAS